MLSESVQSDSAARAARLALVASRGYPGDLAAMMGPGVSDAEFRQRLRLLLSMRQYLIRGSRQDSTPYANYVRELTRLFPNNVAIMNRANAAHPLGRLMLEAGQHAVSESATQIMDVAGPFRDLLRSALVDTNYQRMLGSLRALRAQGSQPQAGVLASKVQRLFSAIAARSEQFSRQIDSRIGSGHESALMPAAAVIDYVRGPDTPDAAAQRGPSAGGPSIPVTPDPTPTPGAQAPRQDAGSSGPLLPIPSFGGDDANRLPSMPPPQGDASDSGPWGGSGDTGMPTEQLAQAIVLIKDLAREFGLSIPRFYAVFRAAVALYFFIKRWRSGGGVSAMSSGEFEDWDEGFASLCSAAMPGRSPTAPGIVSPSSADSARAVMR